MAVDRNKSKAALRLLSMLDAVYYAFAAKSSLVECLAIQFSLHYSVYFLVD